jgi:peptide/nickel transport system permease protein
MHAGIRAHAIRFVLLLAAVVAVNFFLPRLLPGSPLEAAVGEAAAILPAQRVAALRETYDLDRPLRAQMGRYLVGLLHGDLGRSLVTHRPVSQVIGERLPWSLGLVGPAVLIAAALGAALGTAASGRPRGWRWSLAEPLVLGVGTLPEFLVAMALIVLFGVTFKVFPAGGGATPFLAVSGAGGWVTAAADLTWHAALPMATLVIGLVPAVFLLSRNALAGVLSEPYLLTARGKGLGKRRILWHAWRSAMPPVFVLLGLRLAYVVTGAAVVERIFAYPGMGMLLFDAIQQRDYPVMQGVFLLSSGLVLTVNLALDVCAGLLDPRVRDAGT